MSTWRQRFGITLDPVLVFSAGALLLIGLTMMTSASVAVADQTMGSPYYFLKRQTVFLAMSLVASLFVLWMPLSFWSKTGFLWLSLALILLAAVLLPGVGYTANFATRWIELGPVRLQVSEPARLLLFIYVCGYLVRHGEAVRESTMGFVRPMLFIGLACALLLIEPDFGAATVLLGTVLVVMFIGGVRIRDYVVLVFVAVSTMALMIWNTPYRLLRASGFLEPWNDPYDSGFQLIQSLIAISRGGVTGVGLGESIQKLFYLPEAHTDFVFAVLAEELGLIGVLVTMVLFFVLVARGFAIARKAARFNLLFPAYLAYALATWFGLQSFVNMGVALGALPTKGLTLPLMSYGNNALVIAVASCAFLLRVHHETTAAEQAALASPPQSRGAFQ
ncbi:MAG: putative lipid II flippase FtsW [Pseudomonadota bacterium]